MARRSIFKIYRVKDVEKIEHKIYMAGFEDRLNAVDFCNIKVITTLLLFLFLLVSSDFGYITAPLLTIAYVSLFEYVLLDIPLKKRGKKLDHEALYFFEVLTLTLESGRNLERSLWVTTDNVDSELSNEFKKTLEETKYGKSLIEALTDMKKRIPSDTINNIILNITQTSVFGSGILDTLYNQVDFLRDKQILDIKEQINKIPNKISIISVIFIVPLILILILGPFVLNYLG